MPGQIIPMGTKPRLWKSNDAWNCASMAKMGHFRRERFVHQRAESPAQAYQRWEAAVKKISCNLF